MSARAWKRRRRKDRVRVVIAALATSDPALALFACGAIKASSDGKGTMTIRSTVTFDDMRAAAKVLRKAAA